MTVFEDTSFDELNEGHLNRLIEHGRAEGKRLEFKSNFKFTEGGSKIDAHEIAKDVAVFANSAGGDIIYGIEERDGVAVGILGLPGVGTNEALMSSVQNSLRDCVSPYVDVRCRFINVADGKSCFILRVPRSFAAPHAVKKRGDREALWYFKRGEDRALPMDEQDVRRAYNSGVDIPRQIEVFRRSRIAISDTTIAGPHFEKSVRVHAFFIPLASFVSGELLPSSRLMSACEELKLEGGYSVVIPCLEGAFRHAGNHEGIWHSWLLHRNGVVEWTDAGTNFAHHPIPGKPDGRIVHPRYESVICARVEDLKRAFAVIGVTGPLVVCISLTNAKGAVVYSPRFMSGGSPCPVEDVHAVSLSFNSVSEVSIISLLPAFNHVMNAFGILKSRYFKPNGDLF
jgi:hypothetical protein